MATHTTISVGRDSSAYALSRTAGIPLLIGEPEDIETLGVPTSAAELLGAACAGALCARKDST